MRAGSKFRRSSSRPWRPSSQATGRCHAPITNAGGNLPAWQTCLGVRRRRKRAWATGVRAARPLCAGVASGGAGKPGHVLCGHRRRVADRTAAVCARGVCGVPRLQRHATRLRPPCVRRLRTASSGRLHLCRSWFLSHVPGSEDEPDHAQPTRARLASATTATMGDGRGEAAWGRGRAGRP